MAVRIQNYLTYKRAIVRDFTKIKFKMNKSLASVALAALAVVPTSAVKTEFMDNAFSFFDKPLWNNSRVSGVWGGNTMNATSIAKKSNSNNSSSN